MKNNSKSPVYVNEAFCDHVETETSSAEKDRRPDSGQQEKLRPETKTKWSILKNVFGVSFSFSLLFTSFNSLSNLQSSLHQQMGTTSLWIIYASLILSSCFLSTQIIRTLKPKWGICCSMFLYTPYFATLYWPTYYTFIPTAIILGVAGAPLWASKCTYLSKLAEQYSEVTGETFGVIIVRFFGIFFLFLQSSQIWGNLISSAVLSVGISNFSRSEHFLENCGANYCPWFNLSSDAEELPDISNLTTASFGSRATVQPTIIYAMTTVYIVLALCAVSFVALVVDPLSRYGIELGSDEKSVRSNLLATFNHMKKNPYQILIAPLTVWSGIEQGLLSADYTSAFVSCGIGIHMVGYALICFGIFDAVFSYAFTPLVKYVSRAHIFSLGAAINLTLIIVMLTWKPNPDEYAVFFIVPSLWGVADAVWQTQINALYGVVFAGKAEAAFSNYRLWESLGFLFAYVMSTYLCMRVKLYISLTFLALGMTGYFIIEVLERKKTRLEAKMTNQVEMNAEEEQGESNGHTSNVHPITAVLNPWPFLISGGSD